LQHSFITEKAAAADEDAALANAVSSYRALKSGDVPPPADAL
jgi:hypothetical protein